MAWLEARGYKCVRSGGSLGEFDIVAIGEDDILLVQCKTNRGASPAEREAMKSFPAPDNCSKMVHRWDDYAKEPGVRIL